MNYQTETDGLGAAYHREEVADATNPRLGILSDGGGGNDNPVFPVNAGGAPPKPTADGSDSNRYVRRVDTDGSMTGVPGATYQLDTTDGSVSILSRPPSGGTSVHITNTPIQNQGGRYTTAVDTTGAITGIPGAVYEQDSYDGSIRVVSKPSGPPPQDPSGFDPKTSLPYGVSNLGTAADPHFYYQGKRVNADGSLYTESAQKPGYGPEQIDPLTGQVTQVGPDGLIHVIGSVPNAAKPAVSVSYQGFGAGGAGGGGAGGAQLSQLDIIKAQSDAQAQRDALQNAFARETLDKQQAFQAQQNAYSRALQEQAQRADVASRLSAATNDINPGGYAGFLLGGGGNIFNALAHGGTALDNRAMEPAAQLLALSRSLGGVGGSGGVGAPGGAGTPGASGGGSWPGHFGGGPTPAPGPHVDPPGAVDLPGSLNPFQHTNAAGVADWTPGDTFGYYAGNLGDYFANPNTLGTGPSLTPGGLQLASLPRTGQPNFNGAPLGRMGAGITLGPVTPGPGVTPGWQTYADALKARPDISLTQPNIPMPPGTTPYQRAGEQAAYLSGKQAFDAGQPVAAEWLNTYGPQATGVQSNPTRLAGGGMTNAPMAITGDAPLGQRPDAGGARPEMIVNPTHAPIGVVPAGQTRQMMQQAKMGQRMAMLSRLVAMRQGGGQQQPQVQQPTIWQQRAQIANDPTYPDVVPRYADGTGFSTDPFGSQTYGNAATYQYQQPKPITPTPAPAPQPTVAPATVAAKPPIGGTTTTAPALQPNVFHPTNPAQPGFLGPPTPAPAPSGGGLTAQSLAAGAAAGTTGLPGATAADLATIRDLRTNTPTIDMNPLDVGFTSKDPFLQNQYAQGKQLSRGVDARSLLWQAQNARPASASRQDRRALQLQL